ncbi:universal stress protein [Niallia circulans]|uniref:Universal stress protein n=2 Tax=Niallia TaxID=2837506 RepID=A0A0J1HNS7_NIACI|nr:MULTISPECIES: universal stress protein [Bacillaceae]EOR21655.1 hypothetical protein A499_22202 [Niallia nealsonii AAU1]SLL35201.1 UspA domain-containing protein [Mycobacteroides abscessus subsp. abscessus]HEO8421373.1 universal stress protein [Yersinia enterocolitica]KAB7670346.1 universal stress protein [Bacillus sp. B1-b2]KLV15377.1 universal stress protein [Niallia circulans]
MYRNILLATDGSVHSKRAALNAIYIANCCSESKVEIVMVSDPSKAKTETLHNWNSSEFVDKNRGKISEVEKLVKESGLNYEVVILKGEPGQVLVDYINNKGTDLAIMGSRGLNVLQEFVLGSVSHKVTKRANCPVLIVK